jgi:hypothetical protein
MRKRSRAPDRVLGYFPEYTPDKPPRQNNSVLGEEPVAQSFHRQNEKREKGYDILDNTFVNRFETPQAK